MRNSVDVIEIGHDLHRVVDLYISQPQRAQALHILCPHPCLALGQLLGKRAQRSIRRR
jgi:hypothetical protein